MNTSISSPCRNSSEVCRKQALGPLSLCNVECPVRQRAFPLRLHSLRFPAAAFCAGMFLTLALGYAATASAQSPAALPAALEQPAEARPETRAELRRQLQHAAEVLEAQSSAVKIVAKLMGPSVVRVDADVAREADGQFVSGKPESGAGVIIEWKDHYYVLTNRHVVRNSLRQYIRVYLTDGRMLHPTRVLEDSDTDVAILAVSESNLVPASIGNSDRMEVGDFVLAVGSPFGLTNSVTFGIISAKGRRDLRVSEGSITYQDFLQTDASINPGNSGGPLVNLHGEVIGINTAIASKTGHNEGIGFAIPINMFMTVGRQLIETGKVAHAYLGVTLNRNFGPAMAAELGLPRAIGAHVTGITPRSPAVAADLQAGDVILEFNHIPIEDDNHLVSLVSLTPIGKAVPLLVFRDRKTITVMVEVGDRSKFEP